MVAKYPLLHSPPSPKRMTRFIPTTSSGPCWIWPRRLPLSHARSSFGLEVSDMAPAAGPHPDSCLSESTLPKLEPPDPVSVPRKPNAANASFSSTTYTNVSFRDIGLSFAGLRGLEEDLEAALESGKDGTALTPALSKRPPWVPDHLAPQCTDCQGQFHFFYRRHHCRMCGRVFCWRCSRPRIKIPEMKYDSKVRVCYHCCESRLQKKASKWQHVLSEFDIMDMVGEGGMGKVYKVMRKKTSTVLAMKVVEKRSIRCEYSAMAVAVEKFVLSKVKHPFIIQLHESFQTNDKLFFVMDFMSRGDLFHLMHTVSIPEAVVRLFAAEIGMALNYLHECGWIYRDLKPENCLLADDGHVVLMDMGLALKTDKESSRNDTAHPLGTPEYWSPELIRGVGYTVALDYWQLGVCYGYPAD